MDCLQNIIISFFCTHECNDKKFATLGFHICSIDWVFINMHVDTVRHEDVT